MSRIYEALQKAESERKLERPESEARAASERLDDRPPVATVEYEALSSFSEPRMEEASDADFSREIGGLDLGAIQRRPWNPSITRLPSLLERGPAIEQFRSLRSRVYEARDIRPLKSILVSSGLPQEGKSFISANLAVSLARHKNSKVLLIDGDMRRYTLHELLGTESHPGLADYLAGKASIEQIMQRPEETSSQGSGNHVLSNLTFIPGGNGGDKAADLSGNARFGDLLRAAAPYFDWIIVDSSPVVPVSDGVNLARSCDGVLLVARAGITKYTVAQRAAAELRAANILGFVLNAVQENPQTGTYYGYNTNKE
jgi:capsular exopolysaccharide synthesis family protein